MTSVTFEYPQKRLLDSTYDPESISLNHNWLTQNPALLPHYSHWRHSLDLSIKPAITITYGRPNHLLPAWLVLLLISRNPFSQSSVSAQSIFSYTDTQSKKNGPLEEANPLRYGQRMGKELKSIDWSGIRMHISKPQAKTCIAVLMRFKTIRPNFTSEFRYIVYHHLETDVMLRNDWTFFDGIVNS